MRYKNLIILGLVFLIVIGCSTTSYTKRYNKPEKEEKSKTKNVRFTSEESNLKNEKTESIPTIIPEKENFDLDEFKSKYKISKNYNLPLSKREIMLMEIISYLETPYKYGGNGKEGIDCSAFTQNIFTKSNSILLPRTASEQYQKGFKVNNFENLEFGDLVFFNTSKSRFPGHVGIYLGENMFVHASSSQGVTVSTIDTDYFRKRFVGGRRIDNFEF